MQGCPNCGSSDVVFDRDSGEVICRSCGTVIYTDNIDLGPEWRAYNEEHVERRKRIGPPLTCTKVDLGLHTYPTKGEYETRYSSPKLTYKEKKLQNILGEIERLSDVLKLKKYEKETAAQIVRKAFSRGMITKRTKPCVVAAAGILLSCRLHNTPMSLRELVRSMMNPKVKEQQVTRVYRKLVQMLGIKVKVDIDQHLLNLVFHKLNMKCERVVYDTALRILRIARQLRIGSGKSPNSLVAAAVYISLKLHGYDATQYGISKLANTTEVTVRSRIKELMNNMDIIIEV
ncbi:hypothetical protein B6U99_03795 [Candidatus Geothermarchaeota archaeon ex4572_27]|nr:MAG: hypothetical protein B6U99_03795 [Candidatus Geothermarchaeota archaeon ex4572_27]